MPCYFSDSGPCRMFSLFHREGEMCCNLRLHLGTDMLIGVESQLKHRRFN